MSSWWVPSVWIALASSMTVASAEQAPVVAVSIDPGGIPACYGTFDGEHYWNAIGDSKLAEYDAWGQKVGGYNLGAQYAPLELAWDGECIWVACCNGAGTVLKFNPATGTVDGNFTLNPEGMGAGGVQGLAFDGHYLYAGVAQCCSPDNAGFVAKLDPADGSEVSRISGMNNVNGMTITEELEGENLVYDVWVACATFTAKIRTTDMTELGRVITTEDAYRLTSNGEAVFVADWKQNKVYKIRATDCALVDTWSLPADEAPNTIAFDGRYVWTAGDSGKVRLLDPNSGTIVYTLNILGTRGNLSGLVFDGQYMWVGNNRPHGRIYRMCPPSEVSLGVDSARWRQYQ